MRFQAGAYVRELEVKEHAKLDKWLNILPTFRGRGPGYTEKGERLKLVLPATDYQHSEDYIRNVYIDGEFKKKSKKPYWRIAPDKFDISSVKIGPGPVVEIFEKQEFPQKEFKVFALYIGNAEVMTRLDLNLRELDTIQKIYDTLNSSGGKSADKTLIF